jgi:hypothetical protein
MQKFSVSPTQADPTKRPVRLWNRQPALLRLMHSQAALRLRNRMTKYGTIVAALLHNDLHLPRQFHAYAKNLSLREAREALFNQVMDSTLLAMQIASVLSGPFCFGLYIFTHSISPWPFIFTTLAYLPLFMFLSLAIRHWSLEVVRNPSYSEETYFSEEKTQLPPTFKEADNYNREIFGLPLWFAAVTLVVILWRALQPMFASAGESAHLCHTIFGFCVLLAALGWSGSVLLIHSLRGWYSILSETLFAPHPTVQLVDSTATLLYRLGRNLCSEENDWSSVDFRLRVINDLTRITDLLTKPNRPKKRNVQIVTAIQQVQNEIEDDFSKATPYRLQKLLGKLFIHATLGSMGTLKVQIAKDFPESEQPSHSINPQGNQSLLPKFLSAIVYLVATSVVFLASIATPRLGSHWISELPFHFSDAIPTLMNMLLPGVATSVGTILFGWKQGSNQTKPSEE